jgi:hypothetical protein
MLRSTIFFPLFAMALVASVPALASEAVGVPHFNGVELRGGGDVVLVPGPVQRVTIVEGSSQFTHIYVDRQGSLKIDACDRDCPRHYQLRVEIQSPRVPTLAVDGGGEINVAGGFAPERELVAAVNGGGKIDTRAVEAGDVTAAVNGGGDLFVRAASRLTGAVRGGGVVRYWGNPEVTSAINGGGVIQRGY